MAKFRVLPYEHYVVLRGNTNAVAKAYGPGEIVEIEDIAKDVQRAKLEHVDEVQEEENHSEPAPAEEKQKESAPAPSAASLFDGDTKARAVERLKGK